MIALGESVIGLLWLSIMVLFEDVPITPIRLAPAALLALISLGSLAQGANGGVFGWLAAAMNFSLVAHVFVCVARGWQGDLVDRRRRLRRPLLLILAMALVLVLIVQIAVVAGIASLPSKGNYNPIYGALDLPITAMALATAALFLEPRAALLAEPTSRTPTRSDPDADDGALAKLEALMDLDEVWRRESLTVAALAAQVDIPEHRLRQLINHRLGHRNFAAFINARRIAAAQRQLTDPAFDDVSISKIAYDLGFASLGPFNRAFKIATGLTPTEWRRR